MQICLYIEYVWQCIDGEYKKAACCQCRIQLYSTVLWFTGLTSSEKGYVRTILVKLKIIN